MGLAKPLCLGTKAAVGTCSQGASYQHFTTAFCLVRCHLPLLLLLISTRWSCSNTALAAAPRRTVRYRIFYFISVTVFLKWVGFYEKSSSKKKNPTPTETAGPQSA